MENFEKSKQLLSSEEETRVTEFELQLWRVFYGFLRWQEECEKNANGNLFSGNELAILHIIRLKNRPKTITDIERLLNRNDTHNIRYSINKLLKMGLIKKTLLNFNGKNYFFEITELGIKDTDNYFKMRRFILIHMFKELNLDLDEMTKNLTKIKAIYDEADRAVTQNILKSDETTLSNAEKNTNIAPFGRILVVEDHPTTAKVTKKILSDLNYLVDIASSGDIAINLTENNRYEIIFMDIELPDIDGFEITRQIRASKNSLNSLTPIISLTVHDSIKNKKDCIEAGMNAVFTKPLIKEKIEDIFSMFIPKHRDRKIGKNENNSTLEESSLTAPPIGSIINMELGTQLAGGNEALAKEAIEMLMDSFEEELPRLEEACLSKDLIKAQSIVHKLRGGISYCGVPRLNETCIRLDEYLKSGKDDLLGDFYQLLCKEYNEVKDKVLDFLPNNS